MVPSVQINSVGGASSFINCGGLDNNSRGLQINRIASSFTKHSPRPPLQCQNRRSSIQTILVAEKGMLNLLGLPALDALGFLDQPLRQLDTKSINAVLDSNTKPAPGIFQRIMDSMLAKFSFAVAYLDDIIIVSKTVEEHQQHLCAVVESISQYGFKIKLEKCSFFQDEIKYLGQIISKEGRRPDPSKIEAVVKMPSPADVPSLRSYLGMPLDSLLRKDSAWVWNSLCQDAFKKIQSVLASDLLLTHYDPNLPITVAADASNLGIGAVLLHRLPSGSMKAVVHASRSLSPAEKNYSQIEKEGLALIFAVKKFHKMIYGRRFTLQTDHQPLLAIFGSKKGSQSMPQIDSKDGLLFSSPTTSKLSTSEQPNLAKPMLSLVLSTNKLRKQRKSSLCSTNK
uniref:Reverse transcriptase domain-containing protein n=1 Tax=Ditylenchus dipsaci TaxID=166011 RepID=A0A915DSP0_9BILA